VQQIVFVSWREGVEDQFCLNPASDAGKTADECWQVLQAGNTACEPTELSFDSGSPVVQRDGEWVQLGVFRQFD